jgi:protein O-GlcNAc transferase
MMFAFPRLPWQLLPPSQDGGSRSNLQLLLPTVPDLVQILEVAIAHHQAGRLQQAADAYRKVLHAEPQNAEALRLLGLVAMQTGNPDHALGLLHRSLTSDATNPWTHNNLGEVHRLRNEPDLAVKCFARAIALKPDFIEALRSLAAIHAAEGRHAEAALVYGSILKSRPDDAAAHLGVGNTLLYRQRFREARASFESALRVNPQFAEARNNLGKALQYEGKVSEALECFRKAALDSPGFALPFLNMGIALQEQGNFDEARNAYHEALSLDPGLTDTHSRLGTLLHQEGRYAEARASYRKALEKSPRNANLHLNLGNAYFAERRLEGAQASYVNALNASPGLAQAHLNLGRVYRLQGKMQAAIACFREAVASDPDLVEARWAQAMSQLPAVYGDGVSPEASRAEFSRSLQELDAWFDANPSDADYQAVGSQQPFYLAYQDHNNRDLLSRYGNLCVRLMRSWADRQGLRLTPKRAPRSGPIRVGIVSAHIGDHSVWNAIGKGWFRHLDRERFSLHVFYLGTQRNSETQYVFTQAAHFASGPHELRGWVDAILSQRVDILIYPEIGMDPTTSKLASLRLAPVQAASWGHPETTGLPTIDYFISSEDMEPPAARENYREQLVTLPHLGCCYEPLELLDTEVDFAAIGVADNVLSYLCAGMPHKYSPHHDAALIAIARGMPRCQFIFCHDRIHELSAALQGRLESAFRTAGLDPNAYLVFIPWQPRPEFRRLLMRADVYLDTMGFSGFNTVMQAVECALPIVTLEGRFLRGRFGSGILRRMAMDEWVAGSVDAYVDLAVRLGAGTALRERMRAQIVASRNVLFGDVEAVRALETFLARVAGTA